MLDLLRQRNRHMSMDSVIKQARNRFFEKGAWKPQKKKDAGVAHRSAPFPSTGCATSLSVTGVREASLINVPHVVQQCLWSVCVAM